MPDGRGGARAKRRRPPAARTATTALAVAAPAAPAAPAPAVPAPAIAGPVRLTVGSYVVLVENGASGGTLRLVGPDGAEPLEVTLTPEGPVLRLRTGLTVAVEGNVSLRADTLSLQATKALDIASAGSLTLHADGEIRSEARTQALRAVAGDVRVTANDDVVMAGERIKLNC